MIRRLMSWSIVGVCLLLVGGSDAAAQTSQETRPGMRQMMPMYDTKTETTIRGTVETVDEVAPQGRMAGRSGGRSMSGTHIVLKTDKDSIAVHLGPSAFLEENKLKLAKGDELEVLGSRVTMAGEDVVLAREITRGEQTVKLRDAAGRPVWRMGPR
jgi:hypothetical protein